ncbi:MAG: SGNH/GDSL hydrolase family protein [Solobacterium sp.]|nr:SGNH/GDSL hydrolase family protein [Solobacterium sp.]
MFSGKVSKTDITQSTGTSETAVMSQKAVSEISDKVDELEGTIDDFKDGFSRNGNNIFDPTTQLTRENAYASVYEGHINFQIISDYKVFCIPVKEGKKYTFSSKIRFVVPTMEDKYTSTSSANIEYATSIDLSLYPNTRYLFVSFNDATDVSSTLKIAEGTEFIEGLILPGWIKSIDFSDLKGKVTANMMDGYEKGNIFSSAELYAEGHYVIVNNGHIATYIDDRFNTYILPVDSSSKYTFTSVRFALPLAEDKYTALSETLIQNVNTIDMAAYTGVKYIAFSFNKEKYPLSSYIVSKGETLHKDDIYPTWINDAIDAKIRDRKVPYLITTRATLTNGQYFVLPSSRTNLRKGMRVVATADVTGTGGLELGFSVSDKSVNGNHNTIVITDTQAKFAKSGYTYQDEQNHGITISGKIVVIFEYNANGTATYTILANGKSFKHTLDFTLQSVSAPYLMSNGTTLTDCKLTLSCIDIEKKIWCFGDSYFAYSAARWPYYLQEYGYAKNVLLDGFPGEGSVNGIVSFTTLLSMSTPKYVIWFLGMNDGSDPDDSTPSTNWASKRDDFLSLCNQHGVTPIFATIPNVPSINHNGKNAWIKASGYRYIDMCHAVGADVDVNWLGTMLSSDKIHPSEDGARALFAQVVQDFPEIMVV